MAHQMFPAPGVYDALMTLLLITVSACTTPLNFDMPASTVTMPAETSTWLGVDGDFGRRGDGDAARLRA